MSQLPATPVNTTKGVIELGRMNRPTSMAEAFQTLTDYAKQYESCTPTKPSLPPPQVLTDPDDPPVWAKWNESDKVAECHHPGGDLDVYGVGGHLNHFEEHIANLFGQYAGMYSVTGSMAQLIALKIHATNKNAIFASHPTCHIVLHQARAFESLLGMSQLNVGSPTRCMTASDVEQAFTKHWKQPSCLVVELPDRELGGATVEWDELVAMREFTRSRGIKMHLDGARIWEIQPYYRRTFQEIASLFDSVYVSFYKGLQGCDGAMLLGSHEFIQEARIWQHRFGGRLFQTFPLALNSEMVFNRNINTFVGRWKKMKEVVAALTLAQEEFILAHKHELPNVFDRMQAAAKAEAQKKKNTTVSTPSKFEQIDDTTSSSTVSSTSVTPSTTATSSLAPFQPFFYFIPAIPQCPHIHMHLSLPQSDADSLRDSILTSSSISLYDRLRGSSKKRCYWEWKMGTENAQIPTATFVDGWRLFMERRYEQLKKMYLE